MAFWAIICRFKSLFSVGILTLIPVINVIATWSYAGQHLDRSERLRDHMERNLKVGLSAFDNKTRQIWLTFFAEAIVVALFTVSSVCVNQYAYNNWQSFFSYEWISTYNLFHWYELAAWLGSAAFISSGLVRKLHAIYTSHREYDPEYMLEPDERYIERRNAAIAERENPTQPIPEESGVEDDDDDIADPFSHNSPMKVRLEGFGPTRRR